MAAVNALSAALYMAGPLRGQIRDPVGAVDMPADRDGNLLASPTGPQRPAWAPVHVWLSATASGNVATMRFRAKGAAAMTASKCMDLIARLLPTAQQTAVACRQLGESAPVAPMRPIHAETPVDDMRSKYDRVFRAVEKAYAADIHTLVQTRDIAKVHRADHLNLMQARAYRHLVDTEPDLERDFPLRYAVSEAVTTVCTRAMAEDTIASGVRCDGRGFSDLRPIQWDICRAQRYDPPSPRSATAIFGRGDTQVIATATEAAAGGGVPSLQASYYFDGHAMGIGSRASMQRQTGHSQLVTMALLGALRQRLTKSYRVNCDTTESSGSSSMAAVCAAYLALRALGCDIAPVAGIGCGLVGTMNGTETDFTSWRIAVDQLGFEDKHDYMDLKVAGTHDGITMVHLDTKCPFGVPPAIVAAGLEQAVRAISRCTADAAPRAWPTPPAQARRAGRRAACSRR